MWFDSHCHLHLCETGSPVELIDRARAARVEHLLSVGIDLESSRVAVSLTEHEGVYAAVGVHPNSADEWTLARAELEGLVQQSGVVAVGESGLDFYRDAVPPDTQRVAFEGHVELAKRFDKTLVIHTRSSMDEALQVLEGVGAPPRLIFHCWSGDLAQLERAVGLGAFISFAGNVSFKNAEDLRAAAGQVPDDRLLVETDSPYLTPVPNRGKPNEPRHVPFVGEAVAGARGSTPRVIAALTYENAMRAFAL